MSLAFPVTALLDSKYPYARGEVLPQHAVADSAVAATNDGRIWLQPLNREWLGRFTLADKEGLTWIRGHHAEDSPEVKALLAASALSR